MPNRISVVPPRRCTVQRSPADCSYRRKFGPPANSARRRTLTVQSAPNNRKSPWSALRTESRACSRRTRSRRPSSGNPNWCQAREGRRRTPPPPAQRSPSTSSNSHTIPALGTKIADHARPGKGRRSVCFWLAGLLRNENPHSERPNNTRSPRSSLRRRSFLAARYTLSRIREACLPRNLPVTSRGTSRRTALGQRRSPCNTRRSPSLRVSVPRPSPSGVVRSSSCFP